MYKQSSYDCVFNKPIRYTHRRINALSACCFLKNTTRRNYIMSSVRVVSTESATDQSFSSFSTPLPGAGMMSRDRGINRSAKDLVWSHILSRARIYAAKALDIMTRINPIPGGGRHLFRRPSCLPTRTFLGSAQR